MDIITGQLSQGTQLLESVMQLWTEFQFNLVLQNIKQDLWEKEGAFDQIEATLSSLVLAQCLARLKTSNTLRDMIEDL